MTNRPTYQQTDMRGHREVTLSIMGTYRVYRYVPVKRDIVFFLLFHRRIFSLRTDPTTHIIHSTSSRYKAKKKHRIINQNQGVTKHLYKLDA